MHAHAGCLPPGEGPGPTVGVPVCQGRGGELGCQPRAQPRREGVVGAGRDVVERPAHGQQAEYPVRRRGVHPQIAGSGEDLAPVAAAIKQAEQPGRTAHACQRDGPAWIDTDLHRVAITPDGQQSRFQRRSHNRNADPPVRQSAGRCSWLGLAAWLEQDDGVAQ